MVTVRRANVVLTVKESEVDKYKANGFDVIVNGMVVDAAIPNDVNTLKKAFADKNSEIAKLHDVINKLNKEIISLKQQLAQTVISDNNTKKQNNSKKDRLLKDN